MGIIKSTPQAPISQPVAALTERPWRIANNNHYILKREILSIHPKCPANVLLLGPTGAGKSSLINSILTTAKGRRVNRAYTGNIATSFTSTYKHFKDDGILRHCCLCDSMGIEQVLEGGLLLDDLEYLLKGHIKNGYRFRPESKISENNVHFRRNPKIKHGIHCVVFVLEASMVDEVFVTPYMSKIKALQDRAHSHNIPCTLILTKTDQLCKKVREDSGNTLRSVKVRDAVNRAASMFGLPEGNIHPIRNCEVDTDIDAATTNLILIVLKQIMYYASDKIEEENSLEKNNRRNCIVS